MLQNTEISSGGGLYRGSCSNRQFSHSFDDIISVENLLLAWQDFSCGKRSKRDVQEFGLCLMDNILILHRDLQNKRYTHGPYHAFGISDPKPRSIHKARVRDRLLHHAIYRILYPFFNRAFIADSFSCRNGKGTHKALKRFRQFVLIVSKNNMRTCWVLKCDIQKFFANIDHKILIEILRRRIPNEDIIWLLDRVIMSFETHGKISVGLPLGNLTSQLLVNVYMNEFDQFVKHKLKIKHYIRYADDFVFLLPDRNQLDQLIPKIDQFLRERLNLQLHPNKLFIKTVASGVDFLGWVHFPDYSTLRTTSKRRMVKRLKQHPTLETIASYQGLLKHGRTYMLKKKYFSAYQ